MSRKGKYKDQSLVVLDVKTGRIHSGILKYKKPNGKYDNHTDYFLVIDKPTDYEKILLKLDFNLRTHLDRAFVKFKTKTSEDLFLTSLFEVDFSTKDYMCHNPENRGSVLLFSSVENAKVIAKEVVIPELIKQQKYDTEQTQKKYFEMVDDLSNLEKYLETL